MQKPHTPLHKGLLQSGIRGKESRGGVGARRTLYLCRGRLGWGRRMQSKATRGAWGSLPARTGLGSSPELLGCTFDLLRKPGHLSSDTYGMERSDCFEITRLGWQRSWEEAQRHSTVTRQHQHINLQKLGCGEEESGGRKGEGLELRSENRVLGTSVP